MIAKKEPEQVELLAVFSIDEGSSCPNSKVFVVSDNCNEGLPVAHVEQVPVDASSRGTKFSRCTLWPELMKVLLSPS